MITRLILLIVSLSFGCEINIGLIPFNGNWFSFGDKEINEASALCPGEDNTLLFWMGPYHPTSIIMGHKTTTASTLFVSPLGKVSREKSVYNIIRKSVTESRMDYPGDAIVASLKKFDYLIYGKAEICPTC